MCFLVKYPETFVKIAAKYLSSVCTLRSEYCQLVTCMNKTAVPAKILSKSKGRFLLTRLGLQVCKVLVGGLHKAFKELQFQLPRTKMLQP